MTLIPKSKFSKTTVMKPVMTEYRDVNVKRIKFERKTTASGEIDGKKHQLELLITTKNTHPLLGLDSRLDEKTGNNFRNGQNHHKHQLLEHAREHDRVKHNNTQSALRLSVVKFHSIVFSDKVVVVCGDFVRFECYSQFSHPVESQVQVVGVFFWLLSKAPVVALYRLFRHLLSIFFRI